MNFRTYQIILYTVAWASYAIQTQGNSGQEFSEFIIFMFIVIGGLYTETRQHKQTGSNNIVKNSSDVIIHQTNIDEGDVNAS